MNELSKAKAEIDALVERISDPSPRGVGDGQPGGRHALSQRSRDSVHSPPGTDHITIGWDIATCRAVFDFLTDAKDVGGECVGPPNKLVGQAIADLALRIASHDWYERNCEHDVCHDEHGHSDGCVYEGRGGD